MKGRKKLSQLISFIYCLGLGLHCPATGPRVESLSLYVTPSSGKTRHQSEKQIRRNAKEAE
jgi:hypothetical protein